MDNMENREYRSDVFAMLLEDKANALEVYNALNGSDYTDPDEVEMCKLEGSISLTLRNDVAFIINMNLNIWEHQSTFNPNMPLRLLFYVSDTYKSQIFTGNNKRTLYSTRQISIPTPRFAVFYNGREKRPPRETLKLSSAYVHQGAEPELELTCTVYNINVDDDTDITKRSKVLDGYMQFVERVRENVRLEVENPVKEATRWCINNHILEDFFRARGDEVINNMTLDMTFETQMELIARDSREEGREAGREEGREDTSREFISNMLKIGLTDEQIIQITGCTKETLARMKNES